MISNNFDLKPSVPLKRGFFDWCEGNCTRLALCDVVERGGLERSHVCAQACYVRNFKDTVALYEPGSLKSNIFVQKVIMTLEVNRQMPVRPNS